MKIYYCDHYPVPLPEGHRFPMNKYALLHQRVSSSGLFRAEEILPSPPASDDQLRLVHTPEYVQKVICGLLEEKEIRRLGFPWSPQLVERSRHSVGGTLAACRSALVEGLSANLAGGTHHAYPDHGEGYCLFNDVAVAARAMQREGLACRVLLVDLDVHQGNGSVAIFSGDPSVFTFSMHGLKNFPFHKEIGDLDVALPDGIGDEAYLEALQDGLETALDHSRPDLAIYLAGADPYCEDKLGRLALTKGGLAGRDRLVLNRCRRAGLPAAIVMAGGYAKQVEDTVDIQFNTLKIAREISLAQDNSSGA